MKKIIVTMVGLLLNCMSVSAQQINGDLNHDGSLDVTDVTQVVSTILGDKSIEYVTGTGGVSGIGGALQVDNSLVAGKWYNYSYAADSAVAVFEFNINGTYKNCNDYKELEHFKVSTGGYYEFYPFQGKFVFFDYTGWPYREVFVIKLTDDMMILREGPGHEGDDFPYYRDPNFATILSESYIKTYNYGPNRPNTNTPTIHIEMMPVKGGTFQMGATAEQGSDAMLEESPVHSVTLSDFEIGVYEVTQQLWREVMGEGKSKWSVFYGYGDDYPAYYITWDDCQTFIAKLNELGGWNFRLPTEAEWEYAARGGKLSKGYKYSGSNQVANVCCVESGCTDKTLDTSQLCHNELFLYGMSGNVDEWCSDWYGPYSSEAQTNPTGPSTGTYRVLRGGSHDSPAFRCRVSSRNSMEPGFSYPSFGLRLAKDAE